MKKTKIVATIGPASSSKEVLREMIESGLNVCRLNFSHGNYEDHLTAIKQIRELNAEMGMNVSILADLQGPKIRTNEMENNGVLLEVGKEIKILVEKIVGNSERFSINYVKLPQDVKSGEKILLDDGKIMLEVITTDGKTEILCKIIQGGILSSKKGVNLPNTSISLPSLTEKDEKDLHFALDNGADWIALSFVRSAHDIIELKKHISARKHHAKVIAKIEKPEALENIDGIIAESDALMVARGDLGVEIPYQNVPLIQMMESMISSMTPSRAEVNDVANAVLDGTDAVMLSGETSVGKFPVEVIKTMSNIIKEMETHSGIYHKEEIPKENQSRFISDSICFNACRLAQRVKAAAIITMSFSGYTAYKISSQRPNTEIFVFTSNKKILAQLSLVWGVRAFYYNKKISTDHTIADIKQTMKDQSILKLGDLVINIASMPIEDLGSSNMLKLSYID